MDKENCNLFSGIYYEKRRKFHRSLVHKKRICIDFAKGILHQCYTTLFFFFFNEREALLGRLRKALKVLVLSFMPCSSQWEWCVSVLVLLCYNKSNCTDFGKAFNK